MERLGRLFAIVGLQPSILTRTSNTDEAKHPITRVGGLKALLSPDTTRTPPCPTI